MTEQQWLACADPKPMLEFQSGKAADRKLRLFACACCRRIEPMVYLELFGKAVAVVEQYADGQATHQKLSAVSRGITGKGIVWIVTHAYADPHYWAMEPGRLLILTASPRLRAGEVSDWAKEIVDGEAYFQKGASAGDRDLIRAAEDRWQCLILRDLFGNPFRPVPLQRTWRTRTAVKLAQAIYDARSFERLPSLADALEQAGCKTPEILAHCRGAGPHVRGCWVVDAVLGNR